MSAANGVLAVRCYIDEILIPRLPPADKMQAQMTVRGNRTKIPLEFVRVQPYVSPKIQLSNEPEKSRPPGAPDPFQVSTATAH